MRSTYEDYTFTLTRRNYDNEAGGMVAKLEVFSGQVLTDSGLAYIVRDPEKDARGRAIGRREYDVYHTYSRLAVLRGFTSKERAKAFIGEVKGLLDWRALDTSHASSIRLEDGRKLHEAIVEARDAVGGY